MSIDTIKDSSPRAPPDASIELTPGESESQGLVPSKNSVLVFDEFENGRVQIIHSRIMRSRCDTQFWRRNYTTGGGSSTPKPGLLFDFPGSEGADQLGEVAGPLLLLSVD